jgi:hypothetical protein
MTIRIVDHTCRGLEDMVVTAPSGASELSRQLGELLSNAKVSTTPSSNSVHWRRIHLLGIGGTQQHVESLAILEARRTYPNKCPTAEIKMATVALKTLTMLVVPVVVAMTVQAAATPKPCHARVKDHDATRWQLWTGMSSPNGMPLAGSTRRDIYSNDPNVYQSRQPIPYYEIDPHGG